VGFLCHAKARARPPPAQDKATPEDLAQVVKEFNEALMMRFVTIAEPSPAQIDLFRASIATTNSVAEVIRSADGIK
jgi:hypothetical protein